MRRHWWWMLLAVIVVVVGWWATRPPAPVAVKTVRSATGAIIETIIANGAVAAATEIDLKSKASGLVARIPVQEGDRVVPGQVLVELDPESEQQRLRRARLQADASRARHAEATLSLQVAEGELAHERMRVAASVRAARVRRDEAQQRLERRDGAAVAMTGDDVSAVRVALADADEALQLGQERIAALVTQELALQARRHGLSALQAQTEADAVAVEEASTRVADTRVLAPATGTVVQLLARIGQVVGSGIETVNGGTTLLRLADLDRLEVVAQIDETEVPRLKPGLSATVSAAAYPGRTWSATITRIAPRGVRRNNAVDVEVRFALDAGAASALKPEMGVQLQVVTTAVTNAVLVPVEAVQWSKGQATVIRHRDGATMAVLTGATDGTRIQILSGVDPGEEWRVPVAGGASRWRHGTGIDL